MIGELHPSWHGLGRVRMQAIPDASGPTLRGFITDNVAPGSTVITESLASYPAIVKDGFEHKPINVKRSGQKAHEVLPGMHRVASLLKGWVNATLQGKVATEHLPAYLDEFVFRFNLKRPLPTKPVHLHG